MSEQKHLTQHYTVSWGGYMAIVCASSAQHAVAIVQHDHGTRNTWDAHARLTTAEDRTWMEGMGGEVPQ